MVLWGYEDTAVIAATTTMLAAAAWKVYFRLRKDQREDHAEAGSSKSYDAIIEQLREQVDRLAEQMTRVTADLDAERAARYTAQASEARLKIRVEVLESQVRSLGGTL